MLQNEHRTVKLLLGPRNVILTFRSTTRVKTALRDQGELSLQTSVMASLQQLQAF